MAFVILSSALPLFHIACFCRCNKAAHRSIAMQAQAPLAMTCAVVGSSGMLKRWKLGEAIDSHSLVLRLNSAPTEVPLVFHSLFDCKCFFCSFAVF